MMKKKSAYKILLLIIGMVICSLNAFSKEPINEKILSLEAFVSADKIYDGQSFTLRVKLYSSSPRIKYANLLESIELGEKLHKLNISDIRRPNRWVEDSYKGKKCYSTIVFEAPLLAVKTGKVTIDPIKFNIGLINTSIVNDFFWGPIEKNNVENCVLETNKLSFNINSLPSVKNGFSGAIGDFSLQAILPPGEIVADQDIIVIYRLSGIGSLESAIFPEMKNILPDGLKFRSESIQDSNSLIDGKINSTIEVEFTLHVSENGEYAIPPIEMVIFNPDLGKYKTIKSNSLTINVGENYRSSKSSKKIFQI